MEQKYVLVRYKEKFQSLYNSKQYTYFVPDGMRVADEDIVVVDTRYGLELAKVVRVGEISDKAKGKATQWIRAVLVSGKQEVGLVSIGNEVAVSVSSGGAGDSLW